jgi:hypothetical protein
METTSNLLVLAFLVSIGVYTFALIRPQHRMFTKRLGDNVTRKKLSKGFIPLILALFIAIGIINPAQAQQGHATQPSQSTHTVTSSPSPKTSEVTVTEFIPYTSQTQNDASLPQGQTQVIQAGVNGSKQVIYMVTTVSGKETSRTEKAETTNTQPVAQIISVGTYVAPAPTPAPAQACPNGTYVNSAGNTVCSPYTSNLAPAGATAQCSDGTYSFSQSRSGTCSHHGGVATWL